MDSEMSENALKDYTAISDSGCPWLGQKSAPTASEIAFDWPPPRIEPSGRKETHCSQDNMEYHCLFSLFDMDGDGLVNINDFQLFKVVWGVKCAEIEADGKRAIDFDDFINLLSSLPFKAEEPLFHNAVYRLLDGHPRKEALLQVHIDRFIAKIRENQWGKVHKSITEDKIKAYWMIFSLFDMNGDGHLTTYDFETLMLIWGLCPTDAANVLDKLDEVDGTVDFQGFVNLIDFLDLQIEEPLYHFAVFSLLKYHLQVSIIPEALVWNLSAKIRRNFCAREECSLMEHKLRSCKMVFSLFDMDNDGHITSDDFWTLVKTWNLQHFSLDYQLETIDFESFLQIFPSFNINAVEDTRAALNLLNFNGWRGLLPEAPINLFRKCLQGELSRVEADKSYKQTLQQMFELNRIFSLLDYDEDDHLTAKEVETLSLCVCKLPSTEITDLVNKVDVIWDSKIDFVSLLELFKPFSMNPFRIMESPSVLFDLLDRDGDGFLCASDFKRFALIIGQDFSNQDIQGLMLKLDTQGNGQISCHDFCRAMLETCKLCNDLTSSMVELNVIDNIHNAEVAHR